MQDIEAYLSLPYTKLLQADEDGAIVATIKELPGCIAHGSTDEEALSVLREVQRAWIEEALEVGNQVPLPESRELPSGKWLQRVPRSLHAKLVELAATEGCSLNQLVVSMLSEAVASREMPRTAQRNDPLWEPGASEWHFETTHKSSRYHRTIREIKPRVLEAEETHHE